MVLSRRECDRLGFREDFGGDRFGDDRRSSCSIIRRQIACDLWLLHQPVDLHRVVQCMIRLKRQARREAQWQRMRHLPSHPGCSAFQSRQKRFDIRAPEPGYKRRRVFQVRTEPNFANGDVRLGEFRIAELPPCENAGEHVPDFLRHTQLPLRRRGGNSAPFRRSLACVSPLFGLGSAQPGTISTSKHSTTSPS
jgi:hypothetical protein